MKTLSLIAVIEGGAIHTVLTNQKVELDILVLDYDTDGCDLEKVKCIPMEKYFAQALLFRPAVEHNPKRVKELNKLADDPVTMLEVYTVTKALGRENNLSNDFIAFVRKARKQAENEQSDLEGTVARLEASGRGVEIAEEIDLCKAAIALKTMEIA
jgi:hypothetical protein